MQIQAVRQTDALEFYECTASEQSGSRAGFLSIEIPFSLNHRTILNALYSPRPRPFSILHCVRALFNMLEIEIDYYCSSCSRLFRAAMTIYAYASSSPSSASSPFSSSPDTSSSYKTSPSRIHTPSCYHNYPPPRPDTGTSSSARA